MNLSVSKLSDLSGVSVRTLHYYDEIGLLKPASKSQAGYRFYSMASLERLQHILFYRELGFELSQIKDLLDAPNFNKTKAMQDHIELLTLKRDRLSSLISLAKRSLKGEEMSFKEFDMASIEEAKEKYAEEAKEHWGHTAAYAQSVKKTASYDAKDWERIQGEQEEVWSGFAKLAETGKSPSSKEARVLVDKWRDSISRNFYQMTDEIAAGLSEMYVVDERFKNNLDAFGRGTAAFASDAIKASLTQN